MSKPNKDKKRLLSNFFSLSAIQGLNMILPLITLPYLVRILGVEKFGLINFAVSIIMYFNILVSFGFELSATKEISSHRNDIKKIREIFSAVMAIKITLAFISFFILSILVTSLNSLKEEALLFFSTFGIVIGNVVFPSWLFQGMERMKYASYINIITRVTFTALIFVLVRESSDFLYVPILNSLSSMISGFCSLWLINRLFNISLSLPRKDSVLLQLKNSYHFFLSRLANNGSRYFATTIIGIYFGNIAVGYYTMVEKLFYVFVSFSGVVSQAIYPYMNRTKNIDFFKKILFIITDISIIILIPLMYLNEPLLYFLFNAKNIMLSKIFIIMFPGTIFASVSSLIGYPLLASFGYSNHANNSLIYGAIIYISLIIISLFLYKNIYLIALSLVAYKFTVLIFRIYYVRKEKLLTVA